MIRLLIADDHEILREGLEYVVSLSRDISVVGEADDAESTPPALSHHVRRRAAARRIDDGRPILPRDLRDIILKLGARHRINVGKAVEISRVGVSRDGNRRPGRGQEAAASATSTRSTNGPASTTTSAAVGDAPHHSATAPKMTAATHSAFACTAWIVNSPSDIPVLR